MKFCNEFRLLASSSLLFLVLLNSKLIPINGDKILAVIQFGSTSHKSAFQPLFDELAARGHEITYISMFKSSKKNPNITEIIPVDYSEMLKYAPNPFDLREEGKSVNAFYLTELHEKICRIYYENPEVQNILNLKFDLIFMNVFMGECSYGLLSHFKTKTILMSSMPAPSWIANSFGVPTIPSLNSVFFYGYPERMTFMQRILNLSGHVYFYFVRNYMHIPKMESIYREYFPNAESVLEIEREANLMLLNSHPSMNPSTLLLPDMIEVGGMHCRKAKSLQSDLQQFLDESGEDGFIYFSMGSFLQGTKMPEQYRKAFVQAFSKLKQRVLWKYENDEMPDRPANVKTGKWLPQQDILGHPNIKLFITHGGLLSGQEAVYHGVPLLGLPLFADQDGNMDQAQRKGYALTMEMTDLTEELILEKINIMLNDKSFSENVKSVSAAFRDRPEPPIKTAVFWTEYLLRQKEGGRHLRSAGRDMNFAMFNSLEVISLLFTILILGLYILCNLVTQSIRFLLNRNTSQTQLGSVRKIRPKKKILKQQ